MLHFSIRLPFLITAGVILLLTISGSIFVLTHHEAPKPISYVKDEYVRCIHLEGNVTIGNCLNALAHYAYSHYPLLGIGGEIDQLSYQDKNRWCHEAMHYLGWSAYQKEGSVSKAFLKALPECDSGMYHGIMEEYLREHGFTDNIKELIKNVCVDSLENNPDFSEGTKALCYHGLGHGLMFVTASDLKKSLDFCDLLGQTPATECYSGVFMEYKTSKAIGALDNNKNLDDFSQCLGLTPNQAHSCFVTQGLNYLSLAEGDVGKAMQYCEKVPEDYRQVCYFGVGANTPSPGRSHHDSGLACEAARIVSVDAYKGCVQGGLAFVIQLDRGTSKGALDFCSVIDADVRGYCFAEMGATLQSWMLSSDTPQSECKVVPSAYEKQCEDGIAGRE